MSFLHLSLQVTFSHNPQTQPTGSNTLNPFEI